MPKVGYSGGRLLALGMAESLAMYGAEVDFLVNHVPEMYDEFREFSKVTLLVAPFFLGHQRFVDRAVDVVVIVPEQGQARRHAMWVKHAKACGASIVLLNFESPNWFNAVSPFKRDDGLWDGWNTVSRVAYMILSISGEGDRYARQYYRDAPASCRFEYCYPGINTVLADRAAGVAERDKRIVLLTRIDPHKGAETLEPLLDPTLGGYEVMVCIGSGSLPADSHQKWTSRFADLGIDFQVRYGIRGDSKFELLKRSSLLYFPTRFEGFGLPPLEAAYCGLPCACSDLPVLREFGRTAFAYGEPDDPESMRAAIRDALYAPNRLTENQSRIAQIAKMDEWGRRAAGLLEGL